MKVALLSFTLAAGCMGSGSVTTTTEPTVDESAIMAAVAGGAYRTSAQFRKVSDAPYPSALGASSTISVWVTAHDYPAYTKISPEQTGSGATVDTGTLIVREVHDATGAVEKVTLMMKGAPGYNPSVGDFWFGVTAPDGTPTQMGKLTECFGCHIARAQDGNLFGVPVADRIGSPTDGGVAEPDAGTHEDGGQPADMSRGCTDDGGHHHHHCGDM